MIDIDLLADKNFLLTIRLKILVDERNERLVKGIQEEDVLEIGLAQTMLESRCQKITSVQNATEVLEEKEKAWKTEVWPHSYQCDWTSSSVS